MELGAHRELPAISSAPTLDHQGHCPSGATTLLKRANHWMHVGKGLLTFWEPGPALVSIYLSHSTFPHHSPLTLRPIAPIPSVWRPPTHSSTQPTCGEGLSRTWPQCAWLCRMPQNHPPSPRLPTTWQCLRTRLLGPWWARSQPLTWTPQPAQSGEGRAGGGRGGRAEVGGAGPGPGLETGARWQASPTEDEPLLRQITLASWHPGRGLPP